MKIVLLTESFPPERGGIQNYLAHVAGYLHGHQVTVISPKLQRDCHVEPEDSTPAVAKAMAGRRNDAYKIMRRKFFTRLARPQWFWLFISIWRQAKKGEIDILLCGKALFEGQVGYYLKKYLGIPYVIFTYGMEIETWKTNTRTKRQLKRVLSQADRVAYINDVTKQSLHELGVHENQLVEILPGVDDKFFEPVSEDKISAVMKKYNLKQPYILTVSRLVKRKGIDVLIEAFAKLDQTKFGDVQLAICGTGPESRNLIEESEQNLVAPRVKFLGDVPDEDLVPLYAGASIFTLTPQPTAKDIEGFGIVYLEAAAQKVPAIGTNIGGISGAVVSGETGILVEPNSSEAIRDALANLLTDKQKRQTMGLRAHQRAIEFFRWEKRILFLETALKEVVDSVDGKG